MHWCYFSLPSRDESQLIQTIVEATLSKLNRTTLHVAKYPVGIEDRLKELYPIIDIGNNNVRIIGIYGIGGIGKTTLAKALYNTCFNKFESSSFLADVRATSEKHGLLRLQETLLFDMLGARNLKVGNIHRGINIIKDRLRHKRVLLILDDVDRKDQLEALAGVHNWFGLGSRIIITTKNKHLLTTHGANGMYEVRGLDNNDALELLSWNTFKMGKPTEDYLELSKFVADYASGLPLALEVLGSFLSGRSKDQWKSEIHNLEKKPDENIYKILKTSYEALQDDQKALFLDIACFFVGEDKFHVLEVLGDSNFSPIIGIGVLLDMSLITIEFNKLRMHHLIQEMGKEIVRQESPEVGKRSRLWFPDDVFHVLSENTGTNSIEGIMLRLPEPRTLCLKAKSFKKMRRLRLLIFRDVGLSNDIAYLPSSLRFINLPGYKLATLPFNSGPKQLVKLEMPYSEIHQLGEGFKNFEHLKVVNLSHCEFLTKIPDLSTSPNLECLFIDHCTNLAEVHESVGNLTRLVKLDLRLCRKLRIFPRILMSKYFTTLDFQGCSSLKNFPSIFEEMEYLECLDLSGTAITELSSSIELFVCLKELNLSSCSKLMCIPSNIYKLLNLEKLLLGGCSKLSMFPKNVPFPNPDQSPKFLDLFLQICGSFQFLLLKSLELQNCNLSEANFLINPQNNFSMLENLDLSGNKFIILPSFRNLSNLFILNISNCKLLRKIPELPSCLKKLDASNCKSLVETQGEIMAKIISNNISDNVTLKNLNQFLKYQVQVALPGDNIPDWFSRKKFVDDEPISIILTSDTVKKLTAIFVCVACKVGNEALELSLELFDQNDFLLGCLERKVFHIKPGNMGLLYLPATVIASLSSPFCSTSKFRVSFSDLKKSRNAVKSMCGIHVLCDQNETWTYLRHLPPNKRRFPDFPFEDAEYMWSLCRPETEIEMDDLMEIQQLCDCLHVTAGRWKQQASKRIQSLFFLRKKGSSLTEPPVCRSFSIPTMNR
nr:disease resistance protein Roq1-like [Ziziphus jujuba var. spinosa]